MKILALELSSARGSIALVDPDRLCQPDGLKPSSSGDNQGGVYSCEWPNDRKNSGPFFEHLREVRKQCGKPDTIVVGLGPGSYAGTRIAIATAIGLQPASKGRLMGYLLIL